MSLRRKVVLGCVVWISTVTVLHLWINLGVFDPSKGGERFRVGFLPVT